MTDFHSDRFVIIGVGLIGGSVAAALRAAGAVQHVVGVGRGRANMERAMALGVVDEVSDQAGEAVRGADAVLLAVPVRQNAAVLAQIADQIPRGCLLTDAGSTKGDFVADLRRLLPGHLARCVPAHPIAGAELHGVEAAHAALFRDKNVVITPLPENPPDILRRAEALWETCGARLTRMTPAAHDKIFSAVSHLPHVLAYALVHALALRPDRTELFRFAGAGFRDFTRIAGSSPEMWRDIVLANRDALLDDLAAYRGQIDQLTAMIEGGDGKALETLFATARDARGQWLRTGK